MKFEAFELVLSQLQKLLIVIYWSSTSVNKAVLTWFRVSFVFMRGSPERTLRFYPEVTRFKDRHSFVGQRGLQELEI